MKIAVQSGTFVPKNVDIVTKEDVLILLMETSSSGEHEEISINDAEKIYQYFANKGIDWLMNEFLLYASDAGDFDDERIFDILEEL
jgi:hypothetical protein